MPEIKKLQYEITMDETGAIVGTKKFNKVMNETNKRVKKQDAEMKGLGGTLKKMRAGYVLLAGVVTGVLAAAFGKAIKKASQLQEVNAKFKTVFRGVEKEAESMSNELVAAYGLSTIEARKFLSSVQDLFVPLGLDRKAAAGLSGEVVRLARDVASFNDLPTQDVLRDIQSAMVGNYETVRKYGVVLSETAMKQRIFDDTGKEVKGTIDAQERALTVLKMVTEGSSDAIGDFQRTQAGFANQVRIAGARLSDYAAVMGAKLMPLLAPLISAFGRLLTSTEDLRLASMEQSMAQLDLASSSSKLIDRYKVLSDNTNRTAEENDEFRRISVKIRDLMPEVVEGVNKLSGAYDINTTAAENNVKASQEMARFRIEKLFIEAKNALIKQVGALESASQKTDKFNEVTRLATEGITDQTKAVENFVKIYKIVGPVTITAEKAQELLRERLEAIKVMRGKHAESIVAEMDTMEKNIKIIQEASRLNMKIPDEIMAIINKLNERRETEIVLGEAIIETVEKTTEKKDEAAEKDKARVSDYYAYLGEQRELDRLKEEEAYAMALEGLKLKIEEENITRAEGRLLREELDEAHKERLLAITEDKMEKENEFAKEYQAVWATGVMNVTNEYAEGIAEMMTSGEKWKKNWKDFVWDFVKGVMKMIIKLLIMKGVMMAMGGLGFIFGGGGYIPEFAGGGKIAGRPHSSGGVDINAEGGEYMIRKESVTGETLPYIIAINKSMGRLGALAMSTQKGMRFQEGGRVPAAPQTFTRRNIYVDKAEIRTDDPEEMFDKFMELGEDMGVDMMRR